jgi:nicotinate (nicotinamide) nucleotide adenylyltransferase
LLKLVFYTQDVRLKVRHATASDNFESSCRWKDKLEFVITDSGDFTIIWTSFLPDLEPEYAQALVDLVSARFPVSPDYQKLKNLCPEIIFKNNTGEWVFFGGTFNPWHKGHQMCLRLIPDEKVCLILPDRNPHKDLRDIHQVSTILEISTKAKFKKNQFLVPTFLLRPEKNPTVNWVEKMKADFPTQKISLLMGFDSFSQLKTWDRHEDLLSNLSTIYVISRLEEDEEQRVAMEEVKMNNKELNVIFLGRHDSEHVSSTNIRNKKGP